jgi:hypothetical protein
MTEPGSAKKAKKPRPRRPGVFIRMSGKLAQGAREMAASRRVPIHAIFEAAIAAYLSPGAQDQRDALLSRHLARMSRGVETVDFNNKLLVAMVRYLIELELSFLPETATEEERQAVSEKGARRFDRFEQWLTRQLVDPDNLYNRLQSSCVSQNSDFD